MSANEFAAKKTWRFSSAGRASALQAEGQRFESVNLHHLKCRLSSIGRATDL